MKASTFLPSCSNSVSLFISCSNLFFFARFSWIYLLYFLLLLSPPCLDSAHAPVTTHCQGRKPSHPTWEVSAFSPVSLSHSPMSWGCVPPYIMGDVSAPNRMGTHPCWPRCRVSRHSRPTPSRHVPAFRQLITQHRATLYPQNPLSSSSGVARPPLMSDIFHLYCCAILEFGIALVFVVSRAASLVTTSIRSSLALLGIFLTFHVTAGVACCHHCHGLVSECEGNPDKCPPSLRATRYRSGGFG